MHITPNQLPYNRRSAPNHIIHYTVVPVAPLPYTCVYERHHASSIPHPLVLYANGRNVRNVRARRHAARHFLAERWSRGNVTRLSNAVCRSPTCVFTCVRVGRVTGLPGPRKDTQHNERRRRIARQKMMYWKDKATLGRLHLFRGR